MGDGDGERVVDDERADEDRDEAEDDDDRAHAGEEFGHRCLVLGDQCGAGDDLDVATNGGLDLRDDVGLRPTGVSGDCDRVGLAGCRQQLGGGRIGEQHGRRPGRRVGSAEGGGAGNRELPRLVLGEHGGDVTRLVAGLVGAGLVDDDLAVVGGGVAARQFVRVEVVDRHPVRAEGGVLGDVADGLAVGSDELGVAVDAQRHLVDAVDRSDGSGEGGVEAGAGFAVADVDRRRCPDVGVDAFVGLGQRGVVGGTDGVGEDEGAGHEGDTEEHREGGGE